MKPKRRGRLDNNWIGHPRFEASSLRLDLPCFDPQKTKPCISRLFSHSLQSNTLPICYNFAKMLWMERALMRVNCPTCPDNSTTSVPLNLDHLIAKVSQNSREQTIRPQCFPKKFTRQCALCPRYNVRTTYFPRSTTFLRLCFEF